MMDYIQIAAVAIIVIAGIFIYRKKKVDEESRKL
jgi:hypothetical protein